MIISDVHGTMYKKFSLNLAIRQRYQVPGVIFTRNMTFNKIQDGGLAQVCALGVLYSLQFSDHRVFIFNSFKPPTRPAHWWKHSSNTANDGFCVDCFNAVVGCEYGNYYAWCNDMPRMFCSQHQQFCCKTCGRVDTDSQGDPGTGTGGLGGRPPIDQD